MIKEITHNDEWYAIEKGFLRRQDLVELTEGFKKLYAKIVPQYQKDCNDVLESLRERLLTRNKTQVAIINEDSQEHSESEKNLINDALRKSKFNLQLIDYDDDKTKLIIYDSVAENFSTQDIVEIDELIEHTFDSSRLTVKKELIDEWSVDSLFQDFRNRPDSYGLRSNIIRVADPELKLALDIALRPGILLIQQPLERDVTRMIIDLDTYCRELMLVIRFMTFLHTKVLSERIKPLYRLWEDQL
jgi:curved DNA-binding protein CbpA